MDKLAIESALGPETGSFIDEILVFDEIDSTNLESVRRIKSGRKGTRLIVAHAQTAGRGRRSRQWLSPTGGVYMSLSRGFTAEPQSMQALSLVTALSVLVAARRLGAADLQVKWPNDILSGKHKLAGVLLELRCEQDGNYLVFGIGLNLRLAPEAVAAIDRPVTDLATIVGEVLEPPTVIAAIASQLLTDIQKFEDQGFAPFQNPWNRYDRYLNQDIVIQSGGQRIIGKSLGVDQEGALILQSAAGRQLITGGEIFPSLGEIAGDADR